MSALSTDRGQLTVLIVLTVYAVQLGAKVSGTVADPQNPPSVLNETCPTSRTTYSYTAQSGSVMWDAFLCPGYSK